MEKRVKVYAALGVLALLVLGGIVLLTLDNGGGAGTVETTSTPQATGEVGLGLDVVPRRVLIYDSLYREYPNDALLAELVGLFESAGYEVDVYLGFNATLDPLVAIQNYGVVILRAHGAYNGDPDSGRPLGSYIYTGLYYYEAQAIYGEYIAQGEERGYFAKAKILAAGEDSPLYLAASPLFFDEQLGHLNNTIVFFTGCFGADDDRLANIFLDHGAQLYLGWKGNVTWTHADEFLLAWAQSLLETGDPLEAYNQANQTAGPDPYTGAQVLAFYRGMQGGQG